MSTANSTPSPLSKGPIGIQPKITPKATPQPPNAHQTKVDESLYTYPEITTTPGDREVMSLSQLKTLGCSVSTVSRPEFDAKGFLKFVIDRYPKFEAHLADMEFEFYMDKELEKLSTWEIRSLLIQLEKTKSPTDEKNIEILQASSRIGLIMIMGRCLRVGHGLTVLNTVYQSCPEPNQTYDTFLARQYQLRSTYPARQLTAMREFASKKTPATAPAPEAGPPKRDASPKRK